MAYSLYYVAGNPHLNEIRLAAILGQILNGLAYLATKGLEHGSLSCSNILIHPYGDVKIAYQEYCHIRPSQNAEPRDIRALSYIVMELMQGYVKEERAVGVDDLRRWPSDSDAVGFLSETTSATSVIDSNMRIVRVRQRKF
ncbi:uncharacterized protein K441DRAFT_220440 [Cenococcum geophilum 1.58]|uniref:uncharacterized protein n=1 Tax=Cenococcum geophilum 1.58 TaxID=794803 RepID=UPI00358FC085|nr:hypothetical protein K441DRAFT_220440 [Cenococcum geophilum 1.58]